MSLKAFLLRILWSILILLALITCTEIMVRWCLFSDGTCAKWRDPKIYTWRYSVGDRIVRQDDEAKLLARWRSPDLDTAVTGHPLLGWTEGLDSLTLLPNNYREVPDKTPLVLLGAGWKELGAGRLIEDDPVIRTGANLIDLSVPGYSMDQDLLLLEHTLKHFRGGQVLLWIDVDRLDHLQRTFVGRPKPWYKPLPQGGELQGVPINTDVTQYLAEEPADPGLYSYHLIRTLEFADTVMSPQAVQARESALQELSKRLLFMLIQNAAEDRVTVHLILDQRAGGSHAEARRWALEQVCDDQRVKFEGMPQQPVGVPTSVRGEVCAELARKAYYEYDLATDPMIIALRTGPADRTGAFNPLDEIMFRMLNDSPWLGSIKEKALTNKVSFPEMLRKDAQYSLDHYSN